MAKTLSKLAVIVASVLACSYVQADTRLPKWEVGLGLIGIHLPDYPGANEQSSFVLPLPYLVYRGERIQASRGGINTRLFDSETLQVDLGLSGSLPVRSSGNQAREGMEDLDLSGEIGPRIKLRLYQGEKISLWAHVPLRAMATTDFSGVEYQGWKFAPGLRYSQQLSPSLFLSGKLETGYADAGFHDYFYGVDSNEVIVGQREEYQGRGGYTGTNIRFGISRRWENWRAFASLGLQNISGSSFEDSPLVLRSNGVSLVAGFVWTFYKSKNAAEAKLDAEL